MLDRFWSDPLAASVGDGHRRFQQEEAPLGGDHVGAALMAVSNDGLSVGFRFEAKHRQLESALTVLRRVASPHVAAGLAENRRDVPDELRCGEFSDSRDDDNRFNRRVTDLDCEFGFAIADGDQLSVFIDRGDRWFGGDERRF